MSAASVPTQPPTRRKRRWWFYALIAFAVLVVLAVALFIGAMAYWNSLIATYAESQSRPLASVEASPAAVEQLKTRWATFQQAVQAGRATAPLKLSADDLNVFLAQLPGLSSRFRFVINGDKLQGQFSVPLEKPGQPKLKGKHLNGLVTFNLTLPEDGWPELRVAAAEANGKSAPSWLLRRMRKENFLKYLEKDVELSPFLQNLDSIEVRDDFVVLNPLVAQ